MILDARMPDTDGLVLAARIRERAALAAVRMILLSSEDRPVDAARNRTLGIDAYLPKPVQQEELLETIYRVMGRAGSEPPTALAEPAWGAAPYRSRARRRGTSWWPRTTSSAPDSWSSYWPGEVIA